MKERLRTVSKKVVISCALAMAIGGLAFAVITLKGEYNNEQ